MAKGLKLAEGLNGEDPQVEVDKEEEVDDEPGHVWNMLHKQRAGLKKKLKTLTSPLMKKRARKWEGREHPKPLKSKFPMEEDFQKGYIWRLLF